MPLWKGTAEVRCCEGGDGKNREEDCSRGGGRRVIWRGMNEGQITIRISEKAIGKHCFCLLMIHVYEVTPLGVIMFPTRAIN